MLLGYKTVEYRFFESTLTTNAMNGILLTTDAMYLNIFAICILHMYIPSHIRVFTFVRQSQVPPNKEGI
jgi:hypothetical protein